MEAASLWNLEPVAWMLKGEDAQVKKEVEAMIQVKSDTDAFLHFARGLAGLLGQAKKSDQDRGLCDELRNLTKMVEAAVSLQTNSVTLVSTPCTLGPCRPSDFVTNPSAQDMRIEASTVAGTLLVTQMLQQSKDEPAQTQLEKARKVGTFLTQSLGISSKDLPGPVQQRFQTHGVQTQNPGSIQKRLFSSPSKQILCSCPLCIHHSIIV